MKTAWILGQRSDGMHFMKQVPLMPNFETVEGFVHSGMNTQGEGVGCRRSDFDSSEERGVDITYYYSRVFAIYIRSIDENLRDILLIPKGLMLKDVRPEEVKRLDLIECHILESNLRINNPKAELVGGYIYYNESNSEYPLLPYKSEIEGLLEGKLTK